MFTVRNFPSDESSALEKVINFMDDCYDVLNSPFLNKLKTLPI
jgi:hypothetical protein